MDALMMARHVLKKVDSVRVLGQCGVQPPFPQLREHRRTGVAEMEPIVGVQQRLAQ